MSEHIHKAPPPSARLEGLPFLAFERNPAWPVPERAECIALWDRYAMPEHIRAHSELVAAFAVAIAQKLHEAGAEIHVPSTLAAGLLHDLGKFYSIEHGGSHAQIGAAWVMGNIKNPHIAQAVLQHVNWLWDIKAEDDRQLLTLSVIYADKRVMHDSPVGIQERFTDIMKRYGRTEKAKERITFAHKQAEEIEAALSRRIGVPLHEHTLDCGRLVQRA